MSYFLAATGEQGLEEGDVPRQDLLLQGGEVVGQQIFHKISIGVSRNIPGKFYKSIPALEIGLTCRTGHANT